LPDNESEIFLQRGLDRFQVICPSCRFAASGAAEFDLRVRQISGQ